MLVKRHMHKALGFAGFAAVVGISLGTQAAQLEVTATLPDECTVGGGTLAFGNVDPSAQTAPLANTTINVNCAADSDVEISLSGGLYETLGGNGRAMKHATSSEYLNYKLFTDAGFGVPFTAGVAKPYTVSVGDNPISIYGAIDGSQIKPGGDYADTVEITMVVN